MFQTVIMSLNEGFFKSLEIFLLTLLGAIPLGLIISFGSMSGFKPLKGAVKTLVWIIRGSPLMLQLLLDMGVEITPFMADALYAAITTDTGDFRFSNAKKETHEAVAMLYDFGLDHAKVCNEIYDNERMEKLRMHSLAIADMEMIAGGKANIVCVTQKMLEESGAEMWETEGLIDTMRTIAGVEISALLKEDEPEKIKISLRAKSYGEVLTIANTFDGGGHKKAAGGTIRKTI